MIEHTIYKEFIDKISELSDGIYPIITDLDNDLSYVPDKTADFFGFEAGEHTCFFEQLSSCVNDVDLPEYKQEIRYRLMAKNRMIYFMSAWESIPKNI